MEGEQRLTALLDDPATFSWAKMTIRSAMDSDPVDAANVLEVIAAAFDLRAREMISR